MTLAHQETLGMTIFTAFFGVVLILAVRYRRRTGNRHPWFFPSIFGVALGVGLMVVTWRGVVLTGW
jgi:hypothetical protein